jgi:hypothetical protein
VRVLRAVLLVVALAAVCLGAGWWIRSLDAATRRAEFAGLVDELCDDYHQNVDDLGQPPLAGVPAWADRVRPLTLTLAHELEQMRPPGELAADYRVFLGLVQRQLGLLDAERAAAVARDQKAFDRAGATSHKVHAQETAVANKLGLYVCGH